MSLDEWLASCWLTRFQLSDQERHKLLLAAVWVARRRPRLPEGTSVARSHQV